jgi:hypothetical protein
MVGIKNQNRPRWVSGILYAQLHPVWRTEGTYTVVTDSAGVIELMAQLARIPVTA